MGQLKSPTFQILNPTAHRQVYIYHIPKFQNNPSGDYQDLIQTKFVRKGKEVKEEEENEDDK